MKELVLDISKWDGDMNYVDWRDRRNLYGVIVKGGGSDVGRYVDSWFARNYDKVVAAGLHVGAYFYSKALNVEDSIDDARYFIDNCLADRAWDLPVYIDVEEQAQFNLGKRALTDICKAFMDYLNERGYKAGIYTGGYAFNGNMYGDSELSDYADWIAAWAASPPKYIEADFGMWQQGGIRLSDGHIIYDDCSGYHDCDWALIDYPAIIINGEYNNCDENTTPTDIEETTEPTGGVEDVLRVAYGELGYYAPADPEPGSKYGRWLASLTGEDWLAGPSIEIWWCCMFVSYCLYMAKVRCAGFPTWNTDLALGGGASAHLVEKHQIRRGDVLIFDWNFATDATDHIGFATGSPYNGCVDTIEGNVGNAVKELCRDLSNIRYVIRPDYDGQEQTLPNDVVKPDYEAELDIDGYAGHLTIHKWQEQLGTYLDGIITGQIADSYKYRHNIYSIEHNYNKNNPDYDGSKLVAAIQEFVGAEVDGLWGFETSKKIQQKLVDWGYDIGPDGVDGYFGENSVIALQKSLNDGKWG